MMKSRLLLAPAALACVLATAMPASAQVLGGSATGALGGTLSGGLGGLGGAADIGMTGSGGISGASGLGREARRDRLGETRTRGQGAAEKVRDQTRSAAASSANVAADAAANAATTSTDTALSAATTASGAAKLPSSPVKQSGDKAAGQNEPSGLLDASAMSEQSLSGAAALDRTSNDDARSSEHPGPRASANAGGHATATSAFETGKTPQASGAASGSAAADASVSH
jgi:hypothetical protein